MCLCVHALAAVSTEHAVVIRHHKLKLCTHNRCVVAGRGRTNKGGRLVPYHMYVVRAAKWLTPSLHVLVACLFVCPSADTHGTDPNGTLEGTVCEQRSQRACRWRLADVAVPGLLLGIGLGERRSPVVDVLEDGLHAEHGVRDR